MPRVLNPIFCLLFGILWSGMAQAHPAQQGLVLLLPTELYNRGGTLAVAASIVLISVTSRHWLADLYQGRTLGRGVTLGGVHLWFSLCATFGFFALIYVGFAGPNDPQRNVLPLTIWTGWWVGLFLLQATVMDLWRWINPWTGLYQLTIGDSDPVFRLPQSLGAWPALGLFLLFQCFMLADIAPSDPDRLATVALSYWVFTFVGMALFGATAWRRQVECFSVLFDVIGSLRPVRATDRIKIGLPGWESLRRAPLDNGRAVFCLIILVSGSFDGLSETFWWLAQIGINPLAFPGRSAVVTQSLLGLLAANVIVLCLFSTAVWGGILLVRTAGSRTAISFQEAFTTFAISILPIAFGYHFAHYLVSFLVQSQYLLAAFGDPLSKGWNLLNLGSIRITTGFLNTTITVRPILLASVTMVVLSHIVSIAMAHVLAGRFVSTRKDLALLQIFLCILMIFYTFFGLWLLSTPRGA